MPVEKIRSKSVEEIKDEERLRILQLVGGSGSLKDVSDVSTGVSKLEDPSDWAEYLSEKEMELAKKRYPTLLQKHSKQAEAELLHQRAMAAAGMEVDSDAAAVLAEKKRRDLERRDGRWEGEKDLEAAEKAAAELEARRAARRAAEEASVE